MSPTESDIMPSPNLQLHVLSLCYTVTFFDSCVQSITSNYAVRQSQPFQNSPIAYRLQNPPVNQCIEALLWNYICTIRNNEATMLQRCVALKIVVANRLL